MTAPLSPVQRYPDYPSVAVIAYRLGKAHMRKVYDDCGGPGHARPAAELLLSRAEEGSLPPVMMDPLVRLVADLVLFLASTGCGDTPEKAARWLSERPPFLGRGARLRYHVRRLARPCVVAGWNPELLAEVVDEQARAVTPGVFRQLLPEARRAVPLPSH